MGKREFGLAGIGILAAMAIAWAALSIGCTTVNINTSATVGENHTFAKVDGSAWAEVNAASVANENMAASTAGRSHPVSDNLVTSARMIGGAAIAAGLLTGNAPLAAGGAGAVAGSLLTDDEETTGSE